MSKRAVRRKSETPDHEPGIRAVEAHQGATVAANDGRVPATGHVNKRQWVSPAWAGAICLLAGYVTSGIKDLTLPTDLSADNLFAATMARLLEQRAWLLDSPLLGLPGVLDFRVLPTSDGAHVLALKLLALVGMGPFTAVNVYFLAGFALVGATAAWTLERTGLGRGPAILGALVYALLPYHFWRGPMHLFLSLYYAVPIFVYLMLGCLRLIDKREAAGWRTAMVLSAFLACCGGYYAVFYCYLLAFAVAVEGLSQGTWRPVVRGARLIAATGAGIAVNVLPAILFKLHNPDPGRIIRPLQDTEVYALKFTQMFLPLMQHRTRWLANLALHYNRQAPMVNENQSASLGLVMGGLCGIVMVATCLALWRNRLGEDPTWGRLRKLGLVSGWAFLFATVGGLSSMIGFFVTPFIRSANRISVFIAFFILVMAGWLWQMWRGSRVVTDGRKALWGAVGVVCALVAMWDAADIDYFPKRAEAAAMYSQDAAFFGRLQSQVGPQARVFQVPFVRFPEGGLGTQDYYHFRPYLHMTGWQWSFGALTGSQAEAWNMQTASMVGRDPQGFVQRLKQAGFTGVLLARSVPNRDAGFSETGLTGALGAPAMESSNREFAFFRVGN